MWLWLFRGGCTAALELLKKIAERGPWAAVLQEAFDWVRQDLPFLIYSINSARPADQRRASSACLEVVLRKHNAWHRCRMTPCTRLIIVLNRGECTNQPSKCPTQ